MKLLEIIQIVIFSLGSIFLLAISNKSLRNFKLHGFYRFFVFEFTLILVLLNLPFWIENPFSLQQIFSWIALIISILLVVQSFYYLTKLGDSKKREKFEANFKFENTARLVDTGIYKYIRHPMYGSLLFLSLGAMLKHISIVTVILFIAVLLFLILTAKSEEKENIKFFGSAYGDYMKKTKMFIPFLY